MKMLIIIKYVIVVECINLTKGAIMTRVLISMPEAFLQDIDKLAQSETRTRSELIREALRTYINKNKIRKDSYGNAILNANILDEMLA